MTFHSRDQRQCSRFEIGSRLLLILLIMDDKIVSINVEKNKIYEQFTEKVYLVGYFIRLFYFKELMHSKLEN